MNVSIKPFLILTSSPQMASLIYPFPRILAVHLKYAAANTSWKQPPNCQGHMGLLAFMPRTSLRTHSSHHLPTAMARYDYNYTTGLPRKKPDHAAASFGSTSFCVFFFLCFFFSPASFWLQLEPATRAETDAAVRWYHCREGFSYSASFSKGSHCCWKRLVTSWHVDDMPRATQAKQKYVSPAVISNHCWSQRFGAYKPSELKGLTVRYKLSCNKKKM